MKTIYLIKSFLPFIFLPIAPGVVQIELERHGLLTSSSGVLFTILMQIVFSVGVIVWATHKVPKKNESKAFLTMSCVSKKVFHDGRWMSVEKYLADHHNIVVSHGMTPEEAGDWMRESEEWLRAEKESEAYEKAEVGTY